MGDSLKDVSVVLLSYNRPHFLRKALDSLVRLRNPVGEIIMIDNASPASQEIRQLVKEYPQVQAIFNADNRGYTGGMNQGIRLASKDLIFLTEDDILIGDDCLENLKKALLAVSIHDIVAPVIYNESNGSILCAGGEFHLNSVWKIDFHLTLPEPKSNVAGPIETKFIAGATFLTSRETLQSENGFREDFILYMEDVELCIRHIRSGRKMLVIPDAHVFHFEPPTGGAPNAFVEFHRLKNFFALYLLHAGWGAVAAVWLRYGIWLTIKELFSNPSNALRRAKAIAWNLRSLPRLLSDRNALSKRFQEKVGT